MITAEPLELDFEKGRYVAKLHNDFETESARLNNMEPSVNFLRGMLAGIFSKLIGAKTHATAEFSYDGVIVTVEKRQAVSENPTVPPFQTDPVKIVWDLKNSKTTIELYIGKATFFVNGEKRYLESSPVVLNNRTFVPIRPIIEALGGSISWDPIESKVTITLGSNTVELWIGKNIARVNGVMKPIDSSDSNVVPKIINGRTMLPLRFIAEALGCSVNWDGVTIKITIIF